MARDYKKEYANYHSRPDQIKRRAARNAARRAMRGRKELTDEKDVHHKDNNPMNNDKSNLSIVTKHYNRREPRLRVEDLRKWFGKGKKGDWVRVGTDGEIKGDCAREKGEGKPKCMPRSKAHSMDKKDRASSARRKRRADPSVDRPGTGNKPIMVKTDKKESVVYENVNMKNVDKLKAAARDFDKKKTRKHDNFDSISDALSQIVFSMRRLDKSTSGRTDYKHEKIIDKELVRINSIINRTNYGKTGQSEEGKEIVKILNKHKLNGPRGFSKVIFEGVEMDEAYKTPEEASAFEAGKKAARSGKKFSDNPHKDGKLKLAWSKGHNKARTRRESVEMNEQFVVKYAKNKRGPIYQTKFKSQGEAEKFLAQKRKEGMNGIVSKAGKPVSMQKMKDLQKESVDLEEKNVPTNPSLWAKMKAQAKAKFDVYPSAYANGWAAKKYKAAGGGWKKSTKESTEMKTFWDIREGSCGTMNAQTKKDEKPPFVPNRKVGVKKDRFGNVVKDKNRAKHLAKLAMRGEATRTALDRKITNDPKKMTQTQRDNELGQMAHSMKKARDGRPVHPNKQARRDAYRQSQIDRGLRKEGLDERKLDVRNLDDQELFKKAVAIAMDKYPKDRKRAEREIAKLERGKELLSHPTVQTALKRAPYQ